MQAQDKNFLPMRWMSPESLLAGDFSEASDVWAFGILLWEIFTLGCAPYNKLMDMEVVHHVLAGKRLEKPYLCHQELFRLMLKCWSRSSQDRPTFEQLAFQLGSMHLEIASQKHLSIDILTQAPPEYAEIDDTNKVR